MGEGVKPVSDDISKITYSAVMACNYGSVIKALIGRIIDLENKMEVLEKNE